jgi:hypothetical protein
VEAVGVALAGWIFVTFYTTTYRVGEAILQPA